MQLAAQAHALVILQYHHVSDNAPPSTSVSPKRFAQHLAWIEREGFEVVSIEDIALRLRQGKPLPDKTVVISFDDGYRSIYREAYPLLKKRNWPFVVFVNTEPHDKKRPTHMSWRELRDIQNHGATIANHGVTHAYLLRRDGDAAAAQIFNEEIAAAEIRIEEELGVSHKLFAYPFGEYDAAVMKQLAAHGYLGFAQHSGAVPDDVHLQEVPRFPFGGAYGSEQDFLIKLWSLAPVGVASRALDEEEKRIVDPFVPVAVKRPIWRLALPLRYAGRPFSCFASGQGVIEVKTLKGNEKYEIAVQAHTPLKPGRSKYNCTARAPSETSSRARFYWLSKLWVKQNDKGRWAHH